MRRLVRRSVWIAAALLGAAGGGGGPAPVSAGPEDDEAIPQVTEHLAPIRAEHDTLSKSLQYLEATLASPDRKTSDARIYAKAIAEEVGRFKALVAKIRTSGTRFGLTEERDLLREDAELVDALVAACRKLGGVEPPPRSVEDAARDGGWVRDLALQTLQEQVAERMEDEGLKELLEDGAFTEGLKTLVPALRGRLEQTLDRETKRLFGVSFHDAASLRTALAERVRLEVRKQVSKLLFRMSPEGIVVSLVSDLLLEWLGPKVREWLRHKGSLEERTARSVESLEKNRVALNAFPPDAKVDEVRRAVGRAQGAVKATRHLDGDLLGVAGRGGDATAATVPLLDRLGAAKGNLERTIRLATRRFLLENRSYAADFQALEARLAEAIQALNGLASKEPGLDFEALGNHLIGTWQPESIQSPEEFVIEFRRAECVRGGLGPCYEGRLARFSPRFAGVGANALRVGQVFVYARLSRELSAKGTPYFEIQSAEAKDITKDWGRGFLAPLDMFADDVPEAKKYEKLHGVYRFAEWVRLK